MPNYDDIIDGLLDASEERKLFIDRANDRTAELTSQINKSLFESLDKNIFSKFEIDDQGNIKSTDFNHSLLGKLRSIVRSTNKGTSISEIRKEVGDLLVQQLNKSSDYFLAQKIQEDKIKNAAENARTKLLQRLDPDTEDLRPGSLGSIAISDDDMQGVRKEAIKAIASGQSYDEFKKVIQKWIVEDGKTVRNLKTNVYDIFAQNDRIITKDMGDEFGLEHYMYNGGLVNNTRPWCNRYNGKVFNTKEVLAWIKKEWKGKIEVGYDPFIHCGGWRCRHSFDPISEELYDELKGNNGVPSTAHDTITPSSTLAIPSVKNAKEAKQTIIDIYKNNFSITVEKVSFSKKFTIDQANNILPHLNRLSSEYSLDDAFGKNPSNKPPKVMFNSSKKSYGYVKSNQYGLDTINFGHRYDISRGIKERFTKTDDYVILAGKSKVDKKNVEFATVYHEFAHHVSTKYFSKTPEFWKDLSAIQNRYLKEVNELMLDRNFDQLQEIYLGKYANTNHDEFLAESFTEYKLNSKPSKYAVEVGTLFDKYFKR